jgi:hypothetical protein
MTESLNITGGRQTPATRHTNNLQRRERIVLINSLENGITTCVSDWDSKHLELADGDLDGDLIVQTGSLRDWDHRTALSIIRLAQLLTVVGRQFN